MRGPIRGLTRGLGLAWIVAAALIACGGPLERGRSALDAGRYAEAIDAARVGLTAEPDNGELRLLLAEAYLRQERYRDAAEAAVAAQVSGDLDDDEQGRSHRVAAEAMRAVGQDLEAALQATTATRLGAWENDAELRELLRLGVDSALARRRPGDALALLRELRRLGQEAGAGGPDDELILATGRSAAEQLLDMRAFDEALQLLGELTDEFPEADDLWLLRGGVELRLGREEAASSFARYVEGAPADSVADRHVDVARAMMAVPAWSPAIGELEEALRVEPSSMPARLALIEVYLATARLDEADAAIEALLATSREQGDPDVANATLAVAGVLQATGYDDRALQRLVEGNQAVPDFALARALAAVYEQREQPARAEAVMRDHVDRAPARGQAAEAVGDWYLERNRPHAATQFYREAAGAADADASEAIWLKLAQAYAAIDYGFELVAALDAYVDAAGGTFEARRTAFRLLRTHQLWAEAARVVEPLMTEHADNEALRLALGEAWYFAGEPERETALYEEWVADAEQPGAVLLRVAAVFEGRGDYQTAVSWLDRAADTEDGRAEALLELGTAYQMLSEPDRMWSAYDDYVADSGGSLEAHELVLERLSARRFSAEAAAWLERMIEVAPDRTEFRLQRATKLMIAGEPAAERAFVDYILASAELGDDEALLGAARTAIWQMRNEAPPGLAARVLDAVAEARPDAAALALARARHWLDVALSYRTGAGLARARAYDAAARAAFVDYLASSPTDWQVVLRAAGEMDGAGFDDLAVEAYELAFELGADLGLVRQPYALALVRTGQQPARARDLLAAELALDPTRVDMCVQAAGEMAENGDVTEALDLLGRAQAAAGDDDQRRRAFLAGAELLTADGEHEALLELSNAYVESSRDPNAALLETASALNEAGLWDAASERAQLALERSSGQAALRQTLAESAYGSTGDAQAALDAVRSGTDSGDALGSGIGSWYAIASFLEAHFELEAAFEAWGEAVERSPDPFLLIALGEAQLRVGAPPDMGTPEAEMQQGATTDVHCEEPGCELAPALDLFQRALDEADASGVSPGERRQLIERVTRVLTATGYHEAADDWLGRGLVDPELRAAFLLPAAERALARGRDDRGRQMLEAYLDEGGSVADVIELELAHGFRAEPLDRVRRAVLEGPSGEAAELLTSFWAPMVASFGPGTLAVWVDRLEERGAGGPELQWLLVGALLEAGDVAEASLRLASLAGELPEAGLWAATLRADNDDDELARRLAVGAVAAGPSDAAPNPEVLTSLLEVLSVAGEAELADRVGYWMSESSSDVAPVLARLQWLLARRRPDPALELFRRRLAPLAEDSGGQSLRGDPIARAIELFGHFGYPGLALELADDHDTAAPDERLRLAVRYAYAVGDSDRAARLMDRYVAAAGGHWPALVPLGRALAEVGVDEGWRLLEQAVAEAGEAEAREALRTLLEASGGDEERARDSLEAFVRRPGSLYRQLLAASEVAEEAELWAHAADYNERALELMPLRPGPFSAWLRAALAAGDGSRPLARFSSGPRPSDPEATLLGAIDSLPEAPDETSVETRAQAAELALLVEPNDFDRRAARALSFYQRGRVDDAVEAFNRLELRALFDPLNRQAILSALVGVSDSLAVSRALATVGDPNSDVGSVELAALVLAAADHPGAADALREAATRAPLRDAQADQIALRADRLGYAEVACELAGASAAVPSTSERSRLEALSAVCRLDAGESVERVIGDPAAFLAGEAEASSGLLQVADTLLRQGEVDVATQLLRRVARVIELVDGRLVMTGLRDVLELYAQHELNDVAETFVDAHFPELWRHPEVLGPGPE